MKAITLLIILFSVASCLQLESCAVYQGKIKELSCNIVVVKQSDSGMNYWIDGYNPVDKSSISCYNSAGVFILIRNVTSIGDTLVKQKGESFYTVKKKGFNIVFSTECNGSDYAPIRQDTVPKYRMLK